MKKKITKILWWIICKLNPDPEFAGVSISTREVKIKLRKNVFDKNKWVNFSGTVSFWAHNSVGDINEVKIYKNGGKIDEVCVFNRKLSTKELKGVSKNARYREHKSKVAHYMFD